MPPWSCLGQADSDLRNLQPGTHSFYGFCRWKWKKYNQKRFKSLLLSTIRRLRSNIWPEHSLKRPVLKSFKDLRSQTHGPIISPRSNWPYRVWDYAISAFLFRQLWSGKYWQSWRLIIEYWSPAHADVLRSLGIWNTICCACMHLPARREYYVKINVWEVRFSCSCLKFIEW